MIRTLSSGAHHPCRGMVPLHPRPQAPHPDHTMVWSISRGPSVAATKQSQHTTKGAGGETNTMGEEEGSCGTAITTMSPGVGGAAEVASFLFCRAIEVSLHNLSL